MAAAGVTLSSADRAGRAHAEQFAVGCRRPSEPPAFDEPVESHPISSSACCEQRGVTSGPACAAEARTGASEGGALEQPSAPSRRRVASAAAIRGRLWRIRRADERREVAAARSW